MAEGYVMTIPKSVLNKLDQADQKIAKIAETSQKTQKTFVNAFQEMANGVDPLLQKLRELKSLSRVKLDKIFGNASTTAEKTANSVAQVATQLNRVAESPMDTVNRKIQSLRDLLDQSAAASQKMQTQMSAINQGGGVISKNTLAEGSAGSSLTSQIQAELKALELERNLLQQNDRYWKQYIDNLNGSSVASQRKKAEMDKLNSTFRSGSSLLQQQAKAEDELAKSTAKAEKAAERVAKAEARKNAARASKSNKAAIRAEEQYERALKKAEATIAQRTRKIEALANAQKALTATGREYTSRLNRITSETKRLEEANEKAAKSMTKLKKSQSKVFDISGQLQRQLALAFSVSSIKGYIDKLVQVRGEFELQQTALRTILQNKEQADEIWSKTVQLAVRSPFTVKELVTYTKQLAAYRIEADKLYDTNKMLADVSAGLGVSMDRLILAFGQVKAANYLRASEVRQFTEAGVNILGELSTIYTELEGRMVSVGEVQERITKRMVKFGDVEEVFKRITSAGGIFYNMQEVQAETLAGMMSNLQDTFDLMFNEIGKANEGVLKGFVTLLRDIVNSWETIGQTVVPIITALTARWVLLKAATIGANLVAGNYAKGLIGSLRIVQIQLTKTTYATKRLAAAARKANGASLFGGWVFILSGVAIVIWEIYNAISAITKQQRELNKIAAQGQFDAIDKEANYKRLADIISDVTASYQEQDEALKELKRTYGDILPAHLLEAKTIRELKGDYEEATNAIYDYVAAKSKEAQLRYLGETLGEEVSNKSLKAAEQLKKYIKETYNSEVPTARLLGVLSKLGKGFENGEVTLENYKTKFQELADTYLGIKNIDLPNWITKGYGLYSSIAPGLGAYLRDYLDSVKEFSDASKAVMIDDTVAFGDFITTNLNEEKKSIDAKAKELQSALNTLAMSQDKNSIVTDEQVKKAEKKILDFYASIGKEAPKLSEIINNSFLVKKESLNLNKQVYIAWLEELKSRPLPVDDKGSTFKYFEDINKLIKSFDGTEFQQQIAQTITEFGKLNNLDLSGFDKFLAESGDNLQSYAKALKASLPSIIEEIEVLQNPLSLARIGMSQEDIDKKIKKLKEEKKFAEWFLKNNTYDGKANKKEESEANKRLKKQLSLLKEIGKAYEDNLKYYNKEEAAAKTRADYSSSAKEAGISDYVATMTFDTTGLIKAINDVGKQATGDVKLEFERAIADINGKANLEVRIEGIENIKKMLEDAFSGYELSVEIDKSGIFNKDALMKMFGINYKSLDELKELLNNTYPDVSKLSKEQTKDYESYLKKIRDLEDKDRKQRLKDAEKFFTSTLDLAKKAQLESAREISGLTELYNNGVISTEQYASGIEQSMGKVSDAMSKVSFEKLKESPEFIQAMGTMAGYSSTELAKLAQKLRELANESSASMTVEDMTKLYDIINKVEQKSEKVKSPFKKSVWSDLKQIISLQKDYNKELDTYNNIRKKIESLENKKDEIKGQMDTLKSSDTFGKNPGDQETLEKLQNGYREITENIMSANSQLGQSGQKLEGIKGKLDGATGGMGAAMGMIDKIVTGIYQSINATIDLMNQFKELAESNGVDTSKGGWREAQQAGEVLGNVNEKVMSSWNNFKSGNFAGAIADAVGSITTIFTTFNKQHDARREKRIQEEIKLVGKLSKAYEHLSRQIENAYTIDTLNMSYENAERNLQQQMESTKRMIAAEQDKKDSDQDKIDEWNNELINQQEKLEDLRAQKIQELGGFGSGSAMASAAEEFASAWLDAYRETGDGLDALSDKWDEFIQNIIVKQLALKGVNKFLEPIMTMIDEAIGPDGNLSTEELDKIQQAIKKTIPGMNDFYKTLYESFGDALPKPKNASELSGLQTGIQGITAEQSDVIEAYLNSIRFFVVDSNMHLQTIALFFSADPAQNPMFSEMMAQTRLLRSIDDRLASVITSAGNHPLSGFAIKSII